MYDFPSDRSFLRCPRGLRRRVLASDGLDRSQRQVLDPAKRLAIVS
jgi:hypothetical protein